MLKKSLQELLALQKIDMKIRAIKLRLQTMAQERGKIVADFEVVRKSMNDSKRMLQEVQQQVKFSEQSLKEQQDKLQQLLVKSGSVKKVADYNAVMEAIAKQKMLISDLETKGIELLEKADAVNAAAAKQEKHYRTFGRAAQTEVRTIDAEKVKYEEKITELQAQSDEQAKNVSPALADEYKRLLASGRGEPVGRIVNERCSNCNLRVSPMTVDEALKGNLVHCDNCTFLLYLPEEEE